MSYGPRKGRRDLEGMADVLTSLTGREVGIEERGVRLWQLTVGGRPYGHTQPMRAAELWDRLRWMAVGAALCGSAGFAASSREPGAETDSQTALAGEEGDQDEDESEGG